MMRITEDPVYGTPVFTTMGGQSKCPAETMTAARESMVDITIQSRCGEMHDQPCTSDLIGYDSPAHFGVIILNKSPTGISPFVAVNLFKNLEL